MGVGQAALFSQRSPSRGALGRSPETYQQAGLRRGTATSTSYETRGNGPGGSATRFWSALVR